MSLRVALVSLHTSPLEQPGFGDAGGMNVFVVGLADALHAAGVEVEVLTRETGASDETTDARTPGGAPVRFLRAGPRASVPKNGLLEHVGEFAHSMAELPRFDVVHSNYWLSGLAGLQAAERWGVPHVLSLHTVAALKNARLAAGDAPESSERIDAERMLTRASALVLAHTRAESESVVEAYGVPRDRVAVVPPGVDTALFHPAGDLRPLTASGLDVAPHSGGAAASAAPYALVLARIQPLKGVDLALEAVAAVPEQRRPHLVIAGGTSPGHDDYAASLRRRAAEPDLAGRVEFLPAQPRESAAELLRGAAVLLVPSHSETFGMVALEAAASGTPVLAFRTSGLRESVAEGVSGLLLDSRDPAAWGQALGSLLGDPDRLAALRDSALRHGRSRSWAVTADEVLMHYRAVIARAANDSGSPRHDPTHPNERPIP